MTAKARDDVFCHPCGVGLVSDPHTGGIAALNPRLRSDNPSGCSSQLRSGQPSGCWEPCHPFDGIALRLRSDNPPGCCSRLRSDNPSGCDPRLRSGKRDGNPLPSQREDPLPRRTFAPLRFGIRASHFSEPGESLLHVGLGCLPQRSLAYASGWGVCRGDPSLTHGGVADGHDRRDAAARRKPSGQLDPPRINGGDEIVYDGIRHVLIKNSAVAEAAAGTTSGSSAPRSAASGRRERERAEIRLTGLRADRGELGANNLDGVFPIGKLVLKRLQNQTIGVRHASQSSGTRGGRKVQGGSLFLEKSPRNRGRRPRRLPAGRRRG